MSFASVFRHQGNCGFVWRFFRINLAVRSLGRPDQQVEMLGHQHGADDSEVHLVAQLVKRGDEMAPKTPGIEQPRAPISAGRQKMKMAESVVVALPGHSWTVLFGSLKRVRLLL